MISMCWFCAAAGFAENAANASTRPVTPAAHRNDFAVLVMTRSRDRVVERGEYRPTARSRPASRMPPAGSDRLTPVTQITTMVVLVRGGLWVTLQRSFGTLRSSRRLEAKGPDQLLHVVDLVGHEPAHLFRRAAGDDVAVLGQLRDQLRSMG